MSVLVEACVDSVASARAAERGGAGRLELCASLCDAGTTPSAGMIAAVNEHTHIPVFVLVRARGGGFVYSASELAVMRHDVVLARNLGARGIVIGALTRGGRIDMDQTRALADAANGLPVTFHRAFDFTRDLEEALDDLMQLGIPRVLTSGGAQTAQAGAGHIARLVQQAGDRTTIMAGGGVRTEHVPDLLRTGVRELHIRGARVMHPQSTIPQPPLRLRKPLPAQEESWEETDESLIRGIVTATRGGAGE